jgi:hypothetical protein
MSFAKNGFFSAEIEEFRRAIRSSAKLKPWFNYALELNRAGIDLVANAPISQSDKRLTAIHTHFVHIQTGFQAALLLCEHGMVRNAQILLQREIEEVKAMSTLAATPDDNKTTLSAIRRLLEFSAKQRGKSPKLAPDTDGLLETICAACLLLLWAARSFAGVFDRIEVGSELTQQIKAFAELPDALGGKPAAA